VVGEACEAPLFHTEIKIEGGGATLIITLPCYSIAAGNRRGRGREYERYEPSESFPHTLSLRDGNSVFISYKEHLVLYVLFISLFVIARTRGTSRTRDFLERVKEDGCVG